MSLTAGAAALMAAGGALDLFGNVSASNISARAQYESDLRNQQFQREANALGMAYNTAEAEKARSFSALEAAKTRDFNASEARIAREFSALEAQKQRDYQTAMANSAYQRQVADMRAAGLNPYLAYSNGGATVPSGSAASAFAASSGTAHGTSASYSPRALKSSNYAQIVAQGIQNGVSSIAHSAMQIGYLSALPSKMSYQRKK